MKTIKLHGRYNTFSNSFNKARVYFTMADDLSDVIAELYKISLATCKISINGSSPCHGEIAEINIMGRKSTIVFHIDVDEASLNSIAKHAFDRTVEISLTYREEEALARVSSKYYEYLINLMKRVAKASNLGSVEELKYLIDDAYSYYVPINEHMRDVDAKQLEGLIKKYAGDTLPDLDIPVYDPSDSYINLRRKNGICAICDNKSKNIRDGIPLCQDHIKEFDEKGGDKFKKIYIL